MPGKPLELVIIDRFVSRLNDTIKRARTPVNASLRRQLCKLVSHALRQRLRGDDVIYPGMRQMAKWGEVSERMARENMRRIEAWGVAMPVAYTKGGGRSVRYVISLVALKRVLVSIGSNPSPDFLRSFADLPNPEVNPEVFPEVLPEASSASIYTTQEALANVMQLRRGVSPDGL